MRILLDHCVPKRVRTLFPLHIVRTARHAGLSSLDNGALVGTAALSFDVLITTDKNMRFQHDLAALPLPILELNTPRTRFIDIEPLAAFLPAALAATAQFLFVSISLDGTMETLAPRQ